MGTIQAGPHYELSSSELAKWLEDQAANGWWNVDGDPLLTGRLTFPCPVDELATELRKINRPLYVQARKEDDSADGHLIDAAALNEIVARFSENLHVSGPMPKWADDRLLYLCWQGSPHEWLLAEDSATAEQFCEEAAPRRK